LRVALRWVRIAGGNCATAPVKRCSA
jgi:hypothetical protein